MKNRILLSFLLSASIVVNAFAQPTDSTKNTVGLQYNYQYFDKLPSSDWHIIGLEYGRKTNKATYTGRVNYANRFQQNGWQVEGEAYPVLSTKVYAYTGLSYSANVPVFPKWRSGASLYVALPKAWEAEGGLRYLYFDKSIFIATAGLSKYAGLWLLNVRSFVSLNQSLNSQSFFVSARRYFKNEKDYGWLQIGSGISPDETRNVQFENAASLSSKLIMAGLKKTIAKNLQTSLSAGWSWDEYVTNQFGNRWYGAIGLQQHF